MGPVIGAEPRALPDMQAADRVAGVAVGKACATLEFEVGHVHHIDALSFIRIFKTTAVVDSANIFPLFQSEQGNPPGYERKRWTLLNTPSRPDVGGRLSAGLTAVDLVSQAFPLCLEGM